jgi:hypothetical protein
MRSDFSALDAQLDALSPSPAFDVVALARGYAGALDTVNSLSSIDDALSALEAGLPELPELPAPNPNLVLRVEEVREQIELPEPIREPMTVYGLEFELADSELPITARHAEPLEGLKGLQTRESGAFTVYDEKSPHDSAITNAPRRRSTAPRRRDDSRDITMEPMDAELVEAELDELKLTPEAAPLGGVPGTLFDLHTPANAEAELEADAAFAALFAEATRQSGMPALGGSEAADDTQVFSTPAAIDPHSASLLPSKLPFDVALTEPAGARDDNDELEPGFHDETLDSAEFEIVNDVVTDARPANAASQSRPPDKRPSFLGRLFGRKDE